MDLVGQILAKEPLVSRLVAAQALDVVEVEGGGLVFEKLVSLCGGSKYVCFSLFLSAGLVCPCCFFVLSTVRSVLRSMLSSLLVASKSSRCR